MLLFRRKQSLRKEKTHQFGVVINESVYCFFICTPFTCRFVFFLLPILVQKELMKNEKTTVQRLVKYAFLTNHSISMILHVKYISCSKYNFAIMQPTFNIFITVTNQQCS